MAIKTGDVRKAFSYFNQAVNYSLQEIFGMPIIVQRGNDLMINGKKIGGVATMQHDKATIVHGFLRYDKSWAFPLQFLKIDNYPLSPYVNRIDDMTTSVKEFRSDLSYEDFYNNFVNHLSKVINYKEGELTKKEIKSTEIYRVNHVDKKWIYGRGDEVSRGHCDIIEGTKLKIPELEGLVNFS